MGACPASEVMDWSIAPSSAGSLSQSWQLPSRGNSTTVVANLAKLEQQDAADMAAGIPQKKAYFESGPQAKAYFESTQNSWESLPPKTVDPQNGEIGMKADLQYQLQGHKGGDKYSDSLDDMAMPLSASQGQYSLEETAAIEARQSAKKRTFTSTIILAALVGVIVIALVYFAVPGKTPPASPIETACSRMQCPMFNASDNTCRGALYSLCCSDVGGVVACTFPEQRQMAWSMVIEQCPSCKHGCLMDTYFDTEDMYSSPKACGLG